MIIAVLVLELDFLFPQLAVPDPTAGSGAEGAQLWVWSPLESFMVLFKEWTLNLTDLIIESSFLHICCAHLLLWGEESHREAGPVTGDLFSLLFSVTKPLLWVCSLDAEELMGESEMCCCPQQDGNTYMTWSGLFRSRAASPRRCGTPGCVGSCSLGKTVSSESFIFRFPLSTYPVLELSLPGYGEWSISSWPGRPKRPGMPFSGLGKGYIASNSGEEGGDCILFLAYQFIQFISSVPNLI